MTKKLVAYFSVGGVTKNVAEQVAKQVEGNLYEIRPMNPYSKRDLDYLDPMSRSTMEAANPKAGPRSPIGTRASRTTTSSTSDSRSGGGSRRNSLTAFWKRTTSEARRSFRSLRRAGAESET